MVLIHLKQPDADEFFYEAPSGGSLNEIVKELANYGPMRIESERGLEEARIVEVDGDDEEKGQSLKRHDPNGIRNGNAPSAQAAEILERTANEAEAKLMPLSGITKIITSRSSLEESFDLIRGAVMISYPMNLPSWDTVRTLLEDSETFAGHALSKDLLDPLTCLMWWAGKQLSRDQTLSKFVGRNEKTKIVCKLTSKNSGAPSREAAVDAETQRNMMAFYHKKQQENQQLVDDDSDAHLNSAWADPRGLKNAFIGVGNIKWNGRR